MNEMRPNISTEGRISYKAPSLEDLQANSLDEAVQSPSISEFESTVAGLVLRVVEASSVQPSSEPWPQTDGAASSFRRLDVDPFPSLSPLLNATELSEADSASADKLKNDAVSITPSVEIQPEKPLSADTFDAGGPAEIENLPTLRDSFEYAASESGESADSGFGGEEAESRDRSTEGFVPEGKLGTTKWKPPGIAPDQSECVLC
jgi:hypothetical protein